jgi:hypothetical protein
LITDDQVRGLSCAAMSWDFFEQAAGFQIGGNAAPKVWHLRSLHDVYVVVGIIFVVNRFPRRLRQLRSGGRCLAHCPLINSMSAWRRASKNGRNCLRVAPLMQ